MINNNNMIIKFSDSTSKNDDYKLFNIFSTFLQKKKITKKVKFSDKNYIYLIDNTKYKELFYNGLDYYNFRISAQNEINYVMTIKYVDYKEAKKILFQPN